jgi:drug/metabolite transporter (DMT)-like permease
MTIGFIAALVTLCSWSVGTMVFLQAARRIHPALLNKTRLALAVVASATLACVTTGMWPWEVILGATSTQWLWLGLSGFVGLSLGDYFGFTGLRILGARRQSIVGTISPAVAMLSGWALLDESMSMIGVLGMMISVGGVMWSMASVQERNAVQRDGYGSFTKGVLFALGGAFCQGLGLVLAKLGLHAPDAAPLSPFQATFMRMSAGFGALVITDLFSRNVHSNMRDAFRDKVGVRNMLLGVLFGPVIGVTSSLIAAQNIPVGTAQTIFSLVPFVVIGITAVVYRERLQLQVLLGAVIAVIGVLMLVWSEGR